MTTAVISATTAPQDAVAQCAQVIRAASRSFSLAARLLPRQARDEVVVLYAWCRRADDAIDEARPGTAPRALAILRAELASVYGGAPQRDPILMAFQELVRGRGIPQRYPDELLEGMRMDVEGTAYDDTETLLRYCYRVASTVGLMMCHLTGVRDDAALQHAAHLGVAMQLTNICRDVAEDWGRGRRYLPADRLEGLSGSGRTLVGQGPIASFAAPFALATLDLLRQADAYYASADRGLIALPWRVALAVGAARWIYHDIGRVVRSKDADVTAGRAYTSTARKLWLVGRAALAVLASMPYRIMLRLAGRGAMAPPGKALAFEAMERLP
ncbi:MAG: phytoene/squalene synthase family protein [Myxococcales bacterium]|nr:phytoene/squalene synthase family protein [Myxococcales bacterium]